MLFQKKSKDTANNLKNSHNPLKHAGMMGICCLLPIIIITVLPLLNINNPGANIFISGVSSLICPIMMGIMMVAMLRGEKHKGCCKEDNKEEIM